jgi:hypothetical protein
MSASGSSGTAGSDISDGPERGEGGGSEVIDPRILGGVDIGLEGGEAWRRRFVRRDAKNAANRKNEVSLVSGSDCNVQMSTTSQLYKLIGLTDASIQVFANLEACSSNKTKCSGHTSTRLESRNSISNNSRTILLLSDSLLLQLDPREILSTSQSQSGDGSRRKKLRRRSHIIMIMTCRRQDVRSPIAEISVSHELREVEKAFRRGTRGCR